MESDDKAARDLLERRHHGIARCALGVLIDEAADLADAIKAAAWNRVPPPLPEAISRALNPADRVPVGVDPRSPPWRAKGVEPD